MSLTVELKPSLWRTCRVLAGRQRISLLRLLIQEGGAGLTVREIARRQGLNESFASQELRRLNARGLLRCERRGRYAYYSFAPDESVPDAIRLTRALRAGFREAATDFADACYHIATACTHPRRIDILKALGKASRSHRELREATKISEPAIRRHLAKLASRGFVRMEGNLYRIVPQRNPLARALLSIIHASDR